MNYLTTKNLNKSYNGVFAVKNLSLNVPENSIYGFIGKNGAGKTTTLKMILNLIPKTSGKIFLGQKEVKNDDLSYLKNIGSIIETPASYEGLTAVQNLKLHCGYMNLDFSKKRINEVLEQTGLLKDKDKKVKNYSLGMKQRLGIARALYHNPKLLILDEPINGLDPEGIKDFREMILNLVKENGTTVIISSHILSELEIFVTHVGIINKGKLLEENEIDKIKEKCRKTICLRTDNMHFTEKILREEMGINNIKTEKNFLSADIGNLEVESDFLIKRLLNMGIKLQEIYFNNETLEEYFLRITGESI